MIYEHDRHRIAVSALRGGWPNSLKSVHESELLVMVRTVEKHLAEAPKPAPQPAIPDEEAAALRLAEVYANAGDWNGAYSVMKVAHYHATRCAIPAGFVLVPREPTEAMQLAVCRKELEAGPDAILGLSAIWSAMLSASPAAPGTDEGA